MHKAFDSTTFQTMFGDLFGRIFCASKARRSSFSNRDWHFVLMSRAFLQNQDEFELLCHAVRVIKDQEIVATNLQFEPPHRWSLLFSLDYESYISAMKSEAAGPLHGVRKAMFSPSGRWAAIIEEDPVYFHPYAIFGGDSEFLETWVTSLGGIEELRRKFIKYINDPMPVGWQEIPLEVKKALLSDVGWG